MGLGLLVVGSGMLASCGGSNVASKVKPGELKASSAMGGTCSTLGTATPLIVDLPDRAFLEGAMADGVVFVNYDCNTLTILDDCRLEGEYTYSGLSRAEELVTLENNDEVSANMLFTGGTAEANLNSGNALHIGLVRVGRKSTAARVARDQAEGSQCAQATHYIRQAVVGAFAMKTAQMGEVSGAVDVFAVGSGAAASKSTGAREARDADLQACQTSKSTDEAPIEACQSLLRLSLSPVPESMPQRASKEANPKAEEPAEKAVVGDDTVCPEGMTFIGGKCATVTAQTAVMCDPKNSEQCLQSCTGGNTDSCHFYGLLLYGNLCQDPAKESHCDNVLADGNEAAMKADETKSIEFFRKACAANNSEGCRWLGSVSSEYWNSDAGLRTEGLAAYEKACELGNASACYDLGELRFSDDSGIEKDEIQGVADYQRACKLGEMMACRELGEFFFSGKNVTRDPARGLRIMSQFCEQGDSQTCLELGQHLLGTFNDNDLGDPIKPVNMPDAEATGRAMLDRGCKLKDSSACYELGRVLYQGKTYDQAKLYLEAAVANDKGDHDDAEIVLGNMAFNGQGGPANKAQAVEYWSKSEDEDLMLKAAKMLENGDGVIKDTERAGVGLADYCYASEKKSECMKVKALNAKAFDNVMSRHCADEITWACNEFQTSKPAEYKTLVESKCAELGNDPTEFLCERAAALR